MAMCVNRSLVLPRLWLQAQRRSYRAKPKYYREVAQTYAKFRRDVSALRKEFYDEWVKQKTMAQTEFGAKAEEEAHQRQMQEMRAMEEARKELERMAKEREIAQKESEKQIQLKREKGEAARLENEEKTARVYANKVLQVQKTMDDVVTLDNLDAKIQEALDNEILEDFIISPTTGERISKTFRSL